PANLITSFVSGQWVGILMSSVIGHTIGRPAGNASSRSAAVNTAITPGMLDAFETSTESSFAWTYGGRTSSIHTMPAIDWLSMKVPCPSMSLASSFRRTRRPTYCSVVAIGPPLRPQRRPSGRRRAGLHRLAVQVHRARATRRRVAPDVRSGEAQLFPEEVHEERARLDIGLAPHPIHCDRDLRHGSPLLPDGARCGVTPTLIRRWR